MPQAAWLKAYSEKSGRYCATELGRGAPMIDRGDIVRQSTDAAICGSTAGRWLWSVRA